ncbi:putative yippee zinc-binding protein Moh1 [Lichtheimia hyalospora FSU 10163]|nr:putative yippee zinc-binding protein Moh1 [Lichtheimia hyalospora FSU 10163]
MGLKYRVFLEGKKVFACKKCKAHLSTDRKIVSRNFHGEFGQAFLFSDVVNVFPDDELKDKTMSTGRHMIAMINCEWCGTTLGWQYIKAYEDDQKYKEGKFILEKALFMVVN